jgi:hypothetical protein
LCRATALATASAERGGVGVGFEGVGLGIRVSFARIGGSGSDWAGAAAHAGIV